MALKDLNILVIDDDADVLIAMRLLLKSLVNHVVTEKNPKRINSLMREHTFDIVILDMNFNALINTGNEGLFWLKKIKELSADIDVILITAYGDIELAIKALKHGASNFLVKPWKNDKLIGIIKEIEAKRKLSKRNTTKRNSPQMIGKSAVMLNVFSKIEKIAPTDANVLILGENGTGKDLIARAIHDQSLRKDQPFIKIDLGSITDSLFESELFGHVKGAFTDAREDRTGRIESAHGGTLFLDEIGNITLQQQAKLLTVLQNRVVTPIGSNRLVSVDVRLICATNLPLSALADEAKFRKDLIYRINTVEVMSPPLRERDKDIALLAKHFVEIYAEKYFKEDLQLDKSFIKKLKQYPFPGNVRELQYTIEKTVIMSDQSVLTDQDLSFSPIEKPYQTIDQNDLNLDTIERKTIIKVLEKNNGNITKSAVDLGITRTALYRRLNKYDL